MIRHNARTVCMSTTCTITAKTANTSIILPVNPGATPTLPAGQWVVDAPTGDLSIAGPGLKSGLWSKAGRLAFQATAGNTYKFGWKGGTYSTVLAIEPPQSQALGLIGVTQGCDCPSILGELGVTCDSEWIDVDWAKPFDVRAIVNLLNQYPKLTVIARFGAETPAATIPAGTTEAQWNAAWRAKLGPMADQLAPYASRVIVVAGYNEWDSKHYFDAGPLPADWQTRYATIDPVRALRLWRIDAHVRAVQNPIVAYFRSRSEAWKLAAAPTGAGTLDPDCARLGYAAGCDYLDAHPYGGIDVAKKKLAQISSVIPGKPFIFSEINAGGTLEGVAPVLNWARTQGLAVCHYPLVFDPKQPFPVTAVPALLVRNGKQFTRREDYIAAFRAVAIASPQKS